MRAKYLMNTVRPILAAFVLASLAGGQEPASESVEEKGSLIAQRDALAERVDSSFRQGDLVPASEMLQEIYRIETSIFGPAHEELLGTLDYQARIANAAGERNREVELRQAACEMAKQLFAPGSYRLGDLRRALNEANANLTRTDEQRRKLQQANLLHQRANSLRDAGDTAAAFQLAKQATELKGEVLGKKHHSFTSSVALLAALHYDSGQYRKALQLYSEVKKIDEQILGKEHPDYASLLECFAQAYREMGDYRRAKPLFIEAKSIREKVLGKEHFDYASSLNNLAQLYRAIGDYERAEALHLEHKAVCEKVLGKQHYEYGNALNNMAILYQDTGRYEIAESLLREAKNVFAQSLGKESYNYSNCIGNLAGLYVDTGQYRRAEPLFAEAMRITQKVLGNKHPGYAISLNNLASVYEKLADYSRAEPLYVEAQSIWKKAIGTEHPHYANGLSNLALLYYDMGDYERAEPMLVEAAEICRRIFGKNHPSYASSLINLAGLHMSLDDDASAETLLLEAKSILGNVLGQQHEEYANVLNHLASLHESRGDFERAKTLFSEASAIRKKSLGEMHPHYALGLSNLADIYLKTKEYPRAEALYREAEAIYSRSVGEDHPYYATVLNKLAGLYVQTREFTRAASLCRRAIPITLRLLERSAIVQSEEQQILMSQSLRHVLDSYLRCCLSGKLNPEHAVEQIVRWKGSILHRGRALRVAANDPAIKERFRNLQSVVSQLSFTSRSIPSPDKRAAWNDRIASLNQQKHKLEVELAAASSDFRSAIQPVSLDNVRAAIPPDGVVIDYLEYTSWESRRCLLASIIGPDKDPVMIDLGSAVQAGQLIDEWRKSFGMTDEGRKVGFQLRQQLWAPLQEHLAGAETILVSTDGVLGRLPLAALPGERPNTYLIEDHRLALIPVPQLLPDLINKSGKPPLEHDFLLMGDVDYEPRESEPAKPNVASTAKRKRRPWERGVSTARGLDGMKWNRLDETRAEVEFIAGLYKRLFEPDDEAVLDIRGSAATEAAFTEAAPKSMFVHLATHGFFAPQHVKSALSVDSVATFADQPSKSLDDLRPTVQGHHPGQLSGLVFAGANRPPEFRMTSDGMTDDGIMTADEIAFLPLDGVRLVVLSACETGLGEVAGGEGLLGIQRAFQVAGVQSTIATLWKVNDAATRRLMQEFYTNYLDKEMSALDALRETQLWALDHPGSVPRGEVRKRQELDASSSHQDRLSPRYWAPFVLSGDWR